MSSHAEYAWYVARHKWFVLVAGLRTGAPLWRLVIHDWSKLTPTEWGPYVGRFFSGRAGADNFHRAWTHHWHTNPHHWEHWIRAADAGPRVAMDMPEKFVREMVADWMGAGRAITGQWEVAEWYTKNRHRIIITDATRTLVESLIGRVTP